MLENDIYLWIHRQLGETGEVSIEAIQSEFSTEEHTSNFVVEYLDRLVRRDILSEAEDSRYVVVDEELERQEYYQLLEQDVSREEPDASTSHQPVISVPSQLRTEWKTFASKNGASAGLTLQDAFKTTFDNADQILRLIVPYFELDGLNILDEEFRRLAEEEVTVKILTREVTTEADDFSTNKSRKALLEAINRYEEADSEDGTIEVRDYYFAIGSRRPKLDRSIHAKASIADEAVAYVGSGEIRDSSMHLNGEAGYLTRDMDEVKTWARFFDFFWSRADLVREEDLER